VPDRFQADHGDDIDAEIKEMPDSHRTGKQLPTNAGDAVVLIAIDSTSGVLAGDVRAEFQASGEGYLDFLGVDEHVRSRGIGGQLPAAAGAEFVERGASSMSLTVREDNAPARTLYGRLGFTATASSSPSAAASEISSRRR